MVNRRSCDPVLCDLASQSSRVNCKERELRITLKKVASVSPASIFVAFDTNKYFHMKTLVKPVSVCSAMYCIPHVSGDGNGELHGFSSFQLVLWSYFSENSKTCAVWKQPTSPQHNLWGMWRQFGFSTWLVFTAGFCVRIVLLHVCIQTEVYNCWNWGSWRKIQHVVVNCKHIRPQVCLQWPVSYTGIHRFSAVVIWLKVM